MESGELLTLLKETGAILEGHFLLTSGRHSDVYIEKFRILENPGTLDDVCQRMAQVVKNRIKMSTAADMLAKHNKLGMMVDLTVMNLT